MPAEIDLPAAFGRYRLERKLGSGGMGTVYLATETEQGRLVALKVPHLSADDSTETLRRFTREARLAGSIEHPNLCPVLDAGEVDGTPYFTMEYIDGSPLSRQVGVDRPWAASPALALVHKLAVALEVVHGRGIIHRDLKPGNVMIRADGEPVIMDFGLARALAMSSGQVLTATGVAMGTPAYMPPEQFLGQRDTIGPASDVYSLGVILYQLLTGHTPFEGSAVALFGQVLHAEPPPPSSHRPQLAALDELCLKALRKKPQERYASMGEFARALEPYLPLPTTAPDGMPTQPEGASPAGSSTSVTSFSVPPTRWARRGWLLLLLPLLTVLLVGGWVLLHGRDEEGENTGNGKQPPAEVELPPEVTNSIRMKLVLIRPGTFTMGSPKGEEGRRDEEEEEKLIEITRPFYMGVYEVTQAEYLAVMKRNPSVFSPTGDRKDKVEGVDTSRFPVENLTWQEAVDFCRALSEREDEKKARRIYRLPTEAEWEYACRAGTTTAFHYGNSLSGSDAHFNGEPYGDGVRGSYPERATEVGRYGANAWGLYDMHGNVAEYCQDWHEKGYCKRRPSTDPQGPDGPTKGHVRRGGSWTENPSSGRSAARSFIAVEHRRGSGTHGDVGFRVAMDVR